MATYTFSSLRKLAIVGDWFCVLQDVRISVSRFTNSRGFVVAVALERRNAFGKWSIDSEHAYERVFVSDDHIANFWEVNTLDLIHRAVAGSTLPMNHHTYEAP